MRRPLTVGTCFQLQVILCRICVGQCGTETCLFPNTSVFPQQHCLPPTVHNFRNWQSLINNAFKKLVETTKSLLLCAPIASLLGAKLSLHFVLEYSSYSFSLSHVIFYLTLYKINRIIIVAREQYWLCHISSQASHSRWARIAQSV